MVANAWCDTSEKALPVPQWSARPPSWTRSTLSSQTVGCAAQTRWSIQERDNERTAGEGWGEWRQCARGPSTEEEWKRVGGHWRKGVRKSSNGELDGVQFRKPPSVSELAFCRVCPGLSDYIDLITHWSLDKTLHKSRPAQSEVTWLGLHSARIWSKTADQKMSFRSEHGAVAISAQRKRHFQGKKFPDISTQS